MTPVRWGPLSGIPAAERMIDRSVREPLGGRPFGWYEASARMLGMDVYETDNEVVCRAALPGFSEEDIEVTVEGGRLTIRACRPGEKREPKNVRWVCHDLWAGEFLRRLILPIGLDAEKTDVALENGILTVTVPKTEEAKPKEIKVGARDRVQAEIGGGLSRNPFRMGPATRSEEKRNNGMLVKDIMARDIIYRKPNDKIIDSARIMRDRNVGCVVIGDNGSVEGIITDRDVVIRCVADGHNAQCPNSSHMTRSVVTVPPQADILQAAQIMQERKVRRLPVQENGRLVGLVSFSDIAYALDRPVHNLLVGAAAAARHPA